jgi:3-keto-L-gulonate-6-phosphate decarboxylase
LEIVGIVHGGVTPCPCVQLVGAKVEPVIVGSQICQNTVVAEAPETLAAN